MTQFVVQQKKRGDTETSAVVDGGMPPNTGTLYDTANNLSMIRDMRGDCVVRNGFCQEHGQYAQKVTMKRNTWTRSSRTGLFGYKMRKVSVLRCSRTMGTLVETMGTGEGLQTGWWLVYIFSPGSAIAPSRANLTLD